MPSKPIAKTAYQKLLAEVAGIYDRALTDIHAAVERVLKEAYWHIGKRIIETEQGGQLHAAYGEHLLENLSRDLTETNRKGFSVTNLKNMRQVFQAFPIRQLTDELTWTHYVALSQIKDKKERELYAQKTAEKKWAVEELKNILVKDQVKTFSLEVSPAQRLALSGKTSADVKIIRLAVKRGILNVYRVVEDPKKKSIHASSADDLKDKTPGVWLDYGFRIYQKVRPAGETHVKPGDVVMRYDGTSGAEFKKVNPENFKAESVLYTYAAQVAKVIDGDTLSVIVPLGPQMQTKKKLRLKRINTPELDTPLGKKARAFVVKRLKDCPWIVVKTYSTDIYDRYLVDVFYIPDCDDPQRIALEGKLLNQELLDEGLAEVWQTFDPMDLAMMN